MEWRFSLRAPQMGSSGSFSFCALPIFLIPSSNPFMQTNYIGRRLYLVLQDKLMAPQKLLLTQSSDRASVQNCTQRTSPAFPPGSERSPRSRDTELQVTLRLCKVKAGTQKGLRKLESICRTASKRQSDSVFQMLLGKNKQTNAAGAGVWFHASRDGRCGGGQPSRTVRSQLQGGMYVSNVNELHKSVNSMYAK